MQLTPEELLRLTMNLESLAKGGHKRFKEPMCGYCQQTIRLLSTESRFYPGLVTTTIIAENVTSREFKMALIVVLQLYLPYRVLLMETGCLHNRHF